MCFGTFFRGFVEIFCATGGGSGFDCYFRGSMNSPVGAHRWRCEFCNRLGCVGIKGLPLCHDNRRHSPVGSYTDAG